MSRAPANPRTAVQNALIDLRRHLGLTQLQLALALGVTPATTARWETTHPPRGRALDRLAQFADQRGAIVWASIFNGALEQEEERRYNRSLRMADDSLDFEAAISNVYRSVRASGDDPRLAEYWARILEALIPAHRLVIQRAIRDNASVQEMLTREVFTPGEADLVQNSIDGLRDLEHRLVDYQKQAAEKLRTMTTKKRKPTK
jgi:transcriptional regulator with XRE-family HTH domain